MLGGVRGLTLIDRHLAGIHLTGRAGIRTEGFVGNPLFVSRGRYVAAT